MAYKWDFSGVYSYLNLWIKGLGVTLAYSVGTVLGGLIIGVICGMLLLYRRKWVTLPIHYYVEIFRCTPLLVQIVWFYYALPIVLKSSCRPGWRRASASRSTWARSRPRSSAAASSPSTRDSGRRRARSA